MARGGLSGSNRNYQAAARALARSGRIRGAALFLLPVGGGGDSHLVSGSPRRRTGGHRDTRRRRQLCTPVLQDGDRLGQDHRHGDGHRLAHPQQSGCAAGCPLLPQRARDCAGTDGKEPACRARTGGRRQLLRSLQHRALGPARQAAPGESADPQLARTGMGQRGADQETAQRGQARREERRGLHAGGAGRNGQSPQPADHQRRSAPRLASELGGRGQILAHPRFKGQRRRGDGVDRRAGPPAPLSGHTCLLRLFRHALYAFGKKEQRRGALRLDRQRLRAE